MKGKEIMRGDEKKKTKVKTKKREEDKRKEDERKEMLELTELKLRRGDTR